MGIEEEAEKHLDLEERVTNLENLVKQMQDDILKLQLVCAPLYSIDIDLLFREFWSLRLKFNANAAVSFLRQKANETRNPRYEEVASHVEASMHTAVGKMTLADDPLEVARNWYIDVKSYAEKLGITNAFVLAPETIFPKPKQQDEI